MTKLIPMVVVTHKCLKMIKLKQLLVEKTLYHGTLADNASSIKTMGLMPSVGEFVKDAYDMTGYDVDPDEYLKELVFLTDKQQLRKAVTAITAQVAKKLGKDFHGVTDDEFVRNGALAVVKDGDTKLFMSHRPPGDENYYGQHPYTVEPGDYYSEWHVPVDYILTGKKMISFLNRLGMWPRTKAWATYGRRQVKEGYGDYDPEVEALRSEIKRMELDLKIEFPQLANLHIYLRSGGDLYLNSLRVKPNERGKGIGHKVMERIIDFADKHNLYLTLHPVPEPRYKAKLQQFYKSFGLRPNKGRRTLYQYSDPFHINWIRRPQGGGPKNVM